MSGSRWRLKMFWSLLYWGVLFFILFYLSYLCQLPLGGMMFTSLEEGAYLVANKTATPSQYKVMKEVQHHLHSLPMAYIDKYEQARFYKNKSCAKYPGLFEIHFHNTYWQSQRTSNGTFHFYGAYYDNRHLSKIGPSVRVLGVLDRVKPTLTTYCQLWFENIPEPVFSEVIGYEYIRNKEWGNDHEGDWQPYLITCVIPEDFHNLVPESVSVVERLCDIASNNLRVVYNKPIKKKGFAVCVKNLDKLHDDVSARLVEWIELVGILGADKIFFYQLQVHPNITKMLRYYRDLRRVEVIPVTLPGGQPNFPGLQQLYIKEFGFRNVLTELILYNDCFYQNLYTYEYIVLLDIDEIIIPKKELSWGLLFESIHARGHKDFDSYNIRNVYFLDEMRHDTWFEEIPRYMHMLQHARRSRNFTQPGYFVNSFFDTERVLTLHYYYPIACLSSRCSSYSVEVEDAQLQHYTSKCPAELGDRCEYFRENTVLDKSIWRFKDVLLRRSTTTFRSLGYLKYS